MTFNQEMNEAIIEGMVQRRIQNTGEDRRTACLEIKKYLCQHLDSNPRLQNN